MSLLLIGVACPLYMLCGQRHKTYQFFLCHHKEGSGSFARLLKMHLQTHPQVNRQVFLDSDNLEDLSLLFGVVGNRTDTPVVLCSSGILSRPWYVGEMATARLHNIDTFLVRLPDFKWPSLEFLDNYSFHVEGILSLTECGINKEMAKTTLGRLHSRPSMLLPLTVTLSGVDVLARKLLVRKRGKREDVLESGKSVCRSAGAFDSAFEADAPSGETSVSAAHGGDEVGHGPVYQVAEGLSDGKPTANCLVVSIVDQTNQEVVCTASIIKELLKPHFPLISGELCVLLPDEDLPENTRMLLVMCSNGCFRRRSFVGQFLQAQELNASMVPIMVDKYYTHTCCVARSTKGRQLVQLTRKLFQEIAFRVEAQHAEHVLHVRAVAIANRVSDGVVSCASARRETATTTRSNPNRRVKISCH